MDNKKEQDEFFVAFDEIWPVGSFEEESLPEELKVIEIRRIKLALENIAHTEKKLRNLINILGSDVIISD